MQIQDAHAHFFSHRWFEIFCGLSPVLGAGAVPEDMARRVEFDLPPEDPVELARQWVKEMDENDVARMVLLTSHLQDGESVQAAVEAFPERFIGFGMIQGNDPLARDQAHQALDGMSMSGICLFPTMHHYHASDPEVYAVYEEAAAFESPVFIHFGQLEIPVYRRLGIPDPVDRQYANPLDLAKAAGDFADVKFIIPQFGCGCFDEALQLAREHENVLFDSSSSNSWIEPPLDLRTVFKKTLEAVGPERVLFGTDSSAFPRGWRKDIFDEQDRILRKLEVSSKNRDCILGGNLERIFPRS